MIQIGSGSGADDGRVARDPVRCQMGHFRCNLVRIFGWSQIGGQSFASVVETDEAKSDEHKDAGEPVATQHGRRTLIIKKKNFYY